MRHSKPGSRIVAATAILAGLLLFGVQASPVEAGWQVELRNGTVLETRYKPRQASWNRDKVLILTEVGNWISIDRPDIATVRNTLDVQGFGRVINTTTVELGNAPNDAMTPEQIEQAVKAGGSAVLQSLYGLPGQQPQNQTPYSIQQFVEPNATQGIPISFSTNSNFPTGGSSFGSSLFPGSTGLTAPVTAQPTSPPSQ